MNYTKALDLIADTDKKLKEMEAAQYKLRQALAALAEIENGATINLRLICPATSTHAEAVLNIDGILDRALTVDYIKNKIEAVAKLSYAALLQFHPEKIPPEEDQEPGIRIPEELKAKKLETPEKVQTMETPETPAEELPVKIITNGHSTANDKLIEKMYFKEGKSAKKIAAETGLAESCVYNHLNKIKAEKEKAAKECVRR